MVSVKRFTDGLTKEAPPVTGRGLKPGCAQGRPDMLSADFEQTADPAGGWFRLECNIVSNVGGSDRAGDGGGWEAAKNSHGHLVPVRSLRARLGGREARRLESGGVETPGGHEPAAAVGLLALAAEQACLTSVRHGGRTKRGNGKPMPAGSQPAACRNGRPASQPLASRWASLRSTHPTLLVPCPSPTNQPTNRLTNPWPLAYIP